MSTEARGKPAMGSTVGAASLSMSILERTEVKS